MHSFRPTQTDGFTLMELLLYIGLIGMLGTALLRFTVSVSNTRNKNFATQEAQAHGRTAVQLISQRIRAATGINTASSTFGVDPGILSLEMADSSKNPTIIDLTADNGRLRFTEGTSTPLVVSDDTVSISDLTFTNLTSTSVRENVRIQLTAEYNHSSGDIHFDASETFQFSTSVRQ